MEVSFCLLPRRSPFNFLVLLDAFAQFLAATMQVRSHRADGQFQRLRNLLITALFLMVKHQYGLLHRAELLQLLLYRIPELSFRELLLSIGTGMLEAGLPIGLLVGKRDQGAVVPPPSLPFVLRDVGDNAIEIRAEQGFAAKGRQRPV
jgi:hypothetical protein